MQVINQTSQLTGTVHAPTSKSAMQRACAAALIRGGKIILQNPGNSADDQAALGIISQLGATIKTEDGIVIITGNGFAPAGNKIDCGESGLSVRMFTPVASLSKKAITITGSGSLVKRPLGFFNEVLPQLSVDCKSNDGYLPLQVKGPLKPGNIEVDGSLSSQFLTGLLYAYAAANAKDVTIRVKNLNSKPYIDLTLQVMKDFGLKTPENRNYEAFYFSSDDRKINTSTELVYKVEGDWSGAAFLLVAAAIAGNITIKGLDVFSSQADRAVLQPLMQAEAIMSITEQQIEIKKSRLKAFHFNATDCPDLFPPLVALAAYCNGTSVIEGVHRLEHKESNRGLSLQEEFAKLGVEIMLQDDLMVIEGGGLVKSAVTDSHHDHRIAMACAVAGLGANGPVTIQHAEAIQKSYPEFYKDLKKLGAAISEEKENA
jgi:3-phosphoshikimate 1-carboxyvinyltransferase